MKHIKKMKIDIDKKNFEVIPSVQYDNTRFLHINLLNGAVPFNLTGCSVKISGTKHDGTAIFNNCTVINAKEGFIEVELTEQMNAAPGTVKCELKLYSGSGVLTTKHFEIEVTASVTSKNVTSGNEFKALEEALSKVNNIDAKFETLTAENVMRATEKEIQKQISLGNLAHMTIGDEQVTDRKIAKKAITDKHVSQISISKLTQYEGEPIEDCVNLYNQDTMYEQGHWAENGQFNSNAAWYSTGYIEVKPSTVYTKTGARIEGSSFRTDIGEPIAFFNAQKQRIGSVIRDNTFTTPADCKYINALVARPNRVFDDNRLNEYPYSHLREKMAIVEGSSLPSTYPKNGSISNYTLKGLKVNENHIADHSIQPRHIAPDANFGVVHVGRTTPPESAKLWFIPPITIPNIPPSDVPNTTPPSTTPPNNGQNGGFIGDSLVIYLDGRYGMIGNGQVPNGGSIGGTLGVNRHNDYPNNNVECDGLWYNLQPGASITSQHSTLPPTSLASENITIMVRCELPAVINNPLSEATSCMSIGSSPNWTGFYLKPLKDNGTRWNIDANPIGAIPSDIVHGDLKGKSVILIVRKSEGVISTFLNGVLTKTQSHTHNTIGTWKASSDFYISCGMGKIGSVLVYNKALSDEEIQLNINTEISIRGELSPVIDRDQIINMEGDVNA